MIEVIIKRVNISIYSALPAKTHSACRHYITSSAAAPFCNKLSQGAGSNLSQGAGSNLRQGAGSNLSQGAGRGAHV